MPAAVYAGLPWPGDMPMLSAPGSLRIGAATSRIDFNGESARTMTTMYSVSMTASGVTSRYVSGLMPIS